MKIFKHFLPIICLAVLVMYGFKTRQTGGSIIGHVTPPEGASQVLAISATDTFKTAIANGLIQITGIKPGTYRLFITAKPPFKDVLKENIVVTDVATDVGEIVMPK